MPQLGGLDSCVAPSIILAQRVKEPLHLPFDFRCIGVHAALLPVWLRAEGLITYFGKTGKLFDTVARKPGKRITPLWPCARSWSSRPVLGPDSPESGPAPGGPRSPVASAPGPRPSASSA